MSIEEKPYPIAPKGLATSFTETEVPPRYATEFKNRFANAAGGAEKRQGIKQFGTTVPGTPSLDNAHELIKPDGTVILFVSGDGKIYKYDGADYAQVHSGLDDSTTINSLQIGEKLIFYNGVDRNIYTTDGTTFAELEAVLERGQAGAGTTTTVLHDADITDWSVDTNIAINDIIYNATRDGYGIINAVTTASAGHTLIGTAGTGVGNTSADQASGDRYVIIDSVELNIVPTDDPLGPDNTFTGAVGTSATGVVASAVADWTATEIRVGDFIRNTTRSALTQVTAITTAALRCHGVTSQTNGDSFILVKSAMPIAAQAHQHFGWTYYVDSRDKSKIRVAGPDNPLDLYNGATLDTSSLLFGNYQAEGDSVRAVESFQRFLIIAGERSVYFFDGTTPVSGAAGADDLQIRGIFPQGLVSDRAVVSIGDDAIFVSQDGVESVSQTEDSSTLGRANLSEALRTTIRDEISATPEAQIQAVHYRRRSWLLVKVGSKLYCFNYTPMFGTDRLTSKYGRGTVGGNRGAWHEFDGPFANQNGYYVRKNGDLLILGGSGKVYVFDQGTYDDDGVVYDTEYQTGWLTMDEPRRSVRNKRGRYIKPYFKTGASVNYTITARSGLTRVADETITVTAAGGDGTIGVAEVGTTPIGNSGVDDDKYALRWNGEQVQLSFKTSDNKGPDTLSRFVLYVTEHGKR